MPQTNDPDVIRRLLGEPGTWAVVGLSTNAARPAYRIAAWLVESLGKSILAVHPKAEDVHGAPGFTSLDAVEGRTVDVVDCFVASEHVGAVVDDAVANKDRLGIGAVWMQLGVIDEAAARRATDAGLDVVMNLCPRIEWNHLTAR